MNLRPLETMGLVNVLEHLGFPVAGVAWVSERMPFPPANFNWQVPPIPKGNVMLADPLALYWLIDSAAIDPRKAKGLPAGALLVMVIAPLGDSIDDGFMRQRLLCWFDDNRSLHCNPQGPVLTMDDQPVESIMLRSRSGDLAMAGSLAGEVPHAIAGLLEVLRQTGGAL